MGDLVAELSILASDEVHANLRRIGSDLSRFGSYEVFNTFGIAALWSAFGRKAHDFDVVFTVFGPLYARSARAVSIVGFAQPWIIYPTNEVYYSLPFFRRLKTRLKYHVQLLFFRYSDKLVVELDHVKNALISMGFDANRIDVVHNCLSSLYFRPEEWKPLKKPIVKNNFSIGFVGRDYPHKNTDILPKIKKALQDVHGLDVDFYVTFNSSEWSAKSNFFRANVNNVGALDVVQCPNFYQQMDAVIFPSLLECFSATPLEAMVLKKPIFASDRDFVRNVCKDFALYFDPQRPDAAADLIADYIKTQAGHDEAKLVAAREYVIQFSSARQRAEEYLKIMQDATVNRITS